MYRPKSCDKEKLSIPLEPHHKAQSSEIFASFPPKNWKSCNFLSFGQSCWNCIFKLLRSTAFQRRTACPIAAKKSGNSHLFGVVPSRAAQTAFVSELSKTITFCLRSCPGEISHSNSAYQELSNDVSVLVVRRRKVALHTISPLTPTEVWRSAVSTTWEGRRVSSEVPSDTCMRVLGE